MHVYYEGVSLSRLGGSHCDQCCGVLHRLSSWPDVDSKIGVQMRVSNNFTALARILVVPVVTGEVVVAAAAAAAAAGAWLPGQQ